MAGIQDYATVAAANTALFPEGMAPSAVNDGMRQVQADLRAWYNDAEWVQYGDGEGPATVAFASATSFTVAGTDVTGEYHAGRRVRAVGTTTGTIYGTISSSTFSTNTTVNVTWDMGELKSETLTISLGILRAVNRSHSAVITGEIRMYGGDTAPNGWQLCDGSAISRTTFADLFAVISTTYGAGDESTTFNVPDLRGRAPIGAGIGSGLTARALGDMGGEETHTLTEAEMPAHVHTITLSSAGAHTHEINSSNQGSTGGAFELSSGDPNSPPLSTSSAGTHTHSVNNTTKGGDDAHNNMQPFVVVNFIIKT